MKKDTGYDSNHSVSYSNSGEHLHDLHLSVEYGRGLTRRRGSCIKWTTSIQSISLISSLHLWTTPRWILASQTLPFCLPDHLVLCLCSQRSVRLLLLESYPLAASLRVWISSPFNCLMIEEATDPLHSE